MAPFDCPLHFIQKITGKLSNEGGLPVNNLSCFNYQRSASGGESSYGNQYRLFIRTKISSSSVREALRLVSEVP